MELSTFRSSAADARRIRKHPGYQRPVLFIVPELNPVTGLLPWPRRAPDRRVATPLQILSATSFAWSRERIVLREVRDQAVFEKASTRAARLASIGVFRHGSCLVTSAFELPDGVARDVELQGGGGRRGGRRVAVAGMLSRLGNFEFHLG